MKKRVIAFILLLVMNLFFLATFFLQIRNEKFIDVKEIYHPFPEKAASEIILSENDEIHFSVENLIPSVENLILKFGGCLDLQDGWLSVQIANEDKIHYNYEVPVSAIETDDFFLSTGKIPGMKENRSYDITIKVVDLKQQKLSVYLADSGSYLKTEDDAALPIWSYEGKQITPAHGMYVHILVWVILDAACAAVLVCFDRLVTEESRRKISGLMRQGYRKYKTAHKGIHLCIVVLMIVCIAAGIATLRYDQLEEPRTVSYWTHEAPSKFTDIPIEDGQIVQQITTPKGKFEEFILFLENYSADDDATVYVKLEDGKGNACYNWNAPITVLGGEVFCLIGQVDEEVGKGETYNLRIYLEGGNSDITVRSLYAGDYSSDFHGSMGEMTINGQELEDVKLHFFQSYQVSLSYPAIWIAALAVTLLAILLVVWCDVPWLKNILKVICDVCLLLISYFSIELLSGNLYTIDSFFVLLNCVIILCGYWIITAIVGRAAYYIVALLTFAAGITDYYVLLFKGSDFLLTEISAFTTAMSVTGNYKFTVPPVVFTGILLYVCLVLMRVSVDLNSKPITVKRNVIKRASALAGGLAVLLTLNWLVQYIAFDYFTLSTNFEKYGWWYSNSIVLKNSQMKKPADYSDKTIERILSEIEMPEKQEITPKNIIVIMNEALSDLSMIGELETNQDYLPFIRSLTENTVKGNVHVHTYGGGTAISEYEFLTGNSFHFMPMGSMPYSKSDNAQGEPGMASTLKSQGYRTVAMHPYGPKNWNRDRVYDAMGFDEFISIDAFDGAEKIRDYVSDKGNYQKIIEYYEAYQGENLFIFNVTMQNHGGYGIDNGTMETTVSIENIDSVEAEVYLSLIQKSDEAAEYLISYFSEVEEPTMIVMFGDHLPALAEQFYTSLYGKESADRTAVEHSLKVMTPYFIWTNYDSDFEEIGDTSLNYLGRVVLQYAGVELSRYDQFILQQRKKVPAIGKYGVVDQDGNYLEYREELESQLKDYQILQYMRVQDSTSKYRDIFQVKN